MTRLALMRELFEFLRTHKKLWLLPIVIVLFLVGALLISVQSSVLAPFIYTIF